MGDSLPAHAGISEMIASRNGPHPWETLDSRLMIFMIPGGGPANTAEILQ